MYFHHLDDLNERELIPGFLGKMVHLNNMTISYWKIKKGSVLPEHSHPHEQTTNVIEGQLKLTVGEVTRVVEPGTIVAIPADIAHSGVAVTDCTVIDVFSPVREDYKS